jgi:glycosyltransferase involved in cell wall biosynthesis
VLFIGYWGANEGLSQATINPHLKILAEMDRVQEIHYVSIERNIEVSYLMPENPKIIHQPFISRNLPLRLLTKILDIIRLKNFVYKLVCENEIDFIICRSSLAGVLGYLANKKFNVSYLVESFEPHADYMLELGIWSRYGISYLTQQFWEEKQKYTASYLLPVAENYKVKLIKEGVSEKRIVTVPCAVNIERFKFKHSDRSSIRNQLGISSETMVGIYVGKFGGLYMKRDAFKLFKVAFHYFENFHLIILTVQDHDELKYQLVIHEVPLEKVTILTTSHSDVPSYLSAADFAFSLHKPTSVSMFLSPIKNGEYWASGLPVLSPPRIGDDSDIILVEHVGVVFKEDLSDTSDAFTRISKMINIEERVDGHIRQTAIKYRDFTSIRSFYRLVMI